MTTLRHWHARQGRKVRNREYLRSWTASYSEVSSFEGSLGVLVFVVWCFALAEKTRVTGTFCPATREESSTTTTSWRRQGRRPCSPCRHPLRGRCQHCCRTGSRCWSLRPGSSRHSRTRFP